MKVINLWGGPGSGKSTSAAYLFARLKNLGFRAELVGEAAKELIYQGAAVQLENQALLAGLQYRKLVDLERSGCQVAISDSPLLMQSVYAKHLPYYRQIRELLEKLHNSFDNYEAFVLRTKDYDTFGRVQPTVEDAKEKDREIRNLIFDQFELWFPGDIYGQAALAEEVIKLLKKGEVEQ